MGLFMVAGIQEGKGDSSDQNYEIHPKTWRRGEGCVVVVAVACHGRTDGREADSQHL